MVDIDPEKWDRQRKLAATRQDGLTAYDLEIIGKAVRIEVPFDDEFILREVADMLRGFANSIDFTTRRDDLPLRAKLVQLRYEARALNGRIRMMQDQRKQPSRK